MQTQRYQLIILFFLSCTLRADFYLPGWRYYNSDKCVEAKFLNYFTKSEDPQKNKDKMVKMTYTTDKGTTANYAAFVSTKDKAGLADSHEFFKIVKKMNQHEREYFPQYVVCMKDVYFFILGFGSFDSYGLIYQLNPTINEYTASSVRGGSRFDFYDLFTIYLDIFRGYKDVVSHNYYLKEVNSEDVAVNLVQGKSGEMELQGSIRRLHLLRKGTSNDNCNYQALTNYQENLAMFNKNIGNSTVPLNGISTCNNLNINAFLDEFTVKAKIAILEYHKDKDSSFDYCFGEDPYSTANCPEPLKPIWGNKTQAALWRKIRTSILKWTTKSVIDHLIETFETLRDRELSRLADIERALLEATRRNKQLAIDEAARRKAKLMKMMTIAIAKLKLNAKIQINDEEDQLVREHDGQPQRVELGPKAKKLAGLIKKHMHELKNYKSIEQENSVQIIDQSLVMTPEISKNTSKQTSVQQSQTSVTFKSHHTPSLHQSSNNQTFNENSSPNNSNMQNTSNFQRSSQKHNGIVIITNRSESQSPLSTNSQENIMHHSIIKRRKSKIEYSPNTQSQNSSINQTNIQINSISQPNISFNNSVKSLSFKGDSSSVTNDQEDISVFNTQTQIEHNRISHSRKSQDVSIATKSLFIEETTSQNSQPRFTEKSVVLDLENNSSTVSSIKHSSKLSNSSTTSHSVTQSHTSNHSKSTPTFIQSQVKFDLESSNNSSASSQRPVTRKVNQSVEYKSGNSDFMIMTDFPIRSHKSDQSSSRKSISLKRFETVFDKQLMKDRQKVMIELKEVLKKKIKREETMDIDEDTSRGVRDGIVMDSKEKILESDQINLDQEKHKDLLIQLFKKSLKNQIDAVLVEEVRQTEIKKLDSVLEILDMKKAIDQLREASQNSSNDRILDEKISQIGKKIDRAIVKYGSEMELFDSQQVPITLGGLKRELDPYYLKMKQNNHGNLAVANQNNEFIFLV